MKHLLKGFSILSIALLLFSCESTDLDRNKKMTDIQVGDNLRINLGTQARANAWPIPWDCINYEFQWTSSNSEIASADNYGRVTANDVGTTTLTVSQGNISKQLQVEVYEVTLGEKLSAISGLTGFWDFNDPSDPTKTIVGGKMTAYKHDDDQLGSPSMEGITSVDGYNKRDKAIRIGHGSLLYTEHGVGLQSPGDKTVKEYTMLVDLCRPEDSNGWATILNTDITNNNDQDYAIRPQNTIGIGDIGYSANAIVNGTWYRFIAVLKAGEYVRFYMNGTKWHESSPADNDRFQLDPTATLVMGDNDGDDAPLLVSSVAFFNRALTEEEIRSLGGL